VLQAPGALQLPGELGSNWKIVISQSVSLSSADIYTGFPIHLELIVV